MKIYNSLSRSLEEFKPINPPDVGMYTCGPTVYDYQHIGNFRTMVFSDVLRRALVFSGYQVTSVMNITDIDDKTIKGAAEAKVPLEEFTSKYTQIFFDDLKKLNIKPADVVTKATDYVGEMIKYIEELIKKGSAYVEKDGSVYFDISKDKNYGKLSGIKDRELKSGTRILSDEYTKDNIQDFALWKSVGQEEVGYDSPWGRGRPGWHIECSVMSQKNLGDTFDIHLGGIDLLFPHHENEIAQSESKTGKKFVNYFVHGEFLLVDGKKMSKSLHNFYTIRDIEVKGFAPLALRYLYLTALYRKQLNFTWEGLSGAQNTLNKLRSIVSGLKKEKERNVLSNEKLSKVEEYRSRFSEAINDDLNTPGALAILWETVKSNIPSTDKLDLLLSFDEVLGLGLAEVQNGEPKVPDSVKILMDEREQLRQEGEFEKADKIREEIEKLGFPVQDAKKFQS